MSVLHQSAGTLGKADRAFLPKSIIAMATSDRHCQHPFDVFQCYLAEVIMELAEQTMQEAITF